MKKYTVYIDTDLKRRLSGDPMFAQKYADTLRYALSIPNIVMESGWSRGLSTPALVYPNDAHAVFAGFWGNEAFFEAFRKTNRAKYVLSFENGKIVVKAFFLKNSVIFRFVASYDPLTKVGGMKVLDPSPALQPA